MLEFKQGVSEHTIAEAVTAFSNTGGGTVLVGVDPRGRPVGTNTDGEAEARIHRVVARVHRPGRYTLHVLDVENVKGLAIAVSRRQEGHAQTADGRVLVRRGAMNVAGTTYLLTAPTEACGKASIEVFPYPAGQQRKQPTEDHRPATASGDPSQRQRHRVVGPASTAKARAAWARTVSGSSPAATWLTIIVIWAST